MLDATLDRADQNYMPGEYLHAHVQWDLDPPPRAIYLELRWDTEGKGTSDSEAVAEETWSGVPARGNQTWSLKLPRGPLSLSGHLIRIEWSLRCRADGREMNPVAFTISPTRQPIQLTRIPEDDS
ncbi:MAG: hypothetical protein KGQ51_09555 [Planctomycetes bacterium]|nr:hypothetical protein [Planctomycetota bacterium]